MQPLTVRDTMTLDLERQVYRYPGVKAGVIRELFSESPTRYFQRLNALLDRPEALAYAPLTVMRLRRLREVRVGRRAHAREAVGRA